MLEIRGLVAGYGAAPVLSGVDLSARPGEVLGLMGRNGAGKTTLLKAVMGLVRPEAGEIRLDGVRIEALPAHRVARQGIGYVPQGRRLFGELTVAENLAIGLMARRDGAVPAAGERRARVLALFPRLAERQGQIAQTLSGGEQQMLAIARALCLAPKVLLLDEPTEGLQPSMIALIRETVAGLKATGVATILVEQRIETVMRLADRVAFLARGRIAAETGAAGLGPDSPEVLAHVGL